MSLELPESVQRWLAGGSAMDFFFFLVKGRFSRLTMPNGKGRYRNVLTPPNKAKRRETKREEEVTWSLRSCEDTLPRERAPKPM